MIPLNQPFLPPKPEFDELTEGIWNRIWLTNHGPLVKRFESDVSRYLGMQRMVFVNNGTTALQIAIQALGLTGEIITTPYSYVATTNSIVWQQCKPIFVDIDKESFNIDATKIEDAVTDKTSAILATHVYGNPCDVEAIQKAARKHSLKVIYDAAHCFGVKYKGKSIFEYGDISATSFHATKVFHTVEGGGLFTSDDSLHKKMRFMMNFGHNGRYQFQGAGINGKNTEFHAAMGLCNLKYIDQCLQKRKELAAYYDQKILDLPVSKPVIRDNTVYNYAYYPIVFQSRRIRRKVVQHLSEHAVETRSYFHPSLETLHYVPEADVPVSNSISERVLCLPFFYHLSDSDIDLIVDLIKNSIYS